MLDDKHWLSAARPQGLREEGQRRDACGVDVVGEPFQGLGLLMVGELMSAAELDASPRRHPAWRRRELERGCFTERGNLVTPIWRDGPIGSSKVCDVTGGGRGTGWSACAPADGPVRSLTSALRARPVNGSRMSREIHVRFRERAEVKSSARLTLSWASSTSPTLDVSGTRCVRG